MGYTGPLSRLHILSGTGGRGLWFEVGFIYHFSSITNITGSNEGGVVEWGVVGCRVVEWCVE